MDHMDFSISVAHIHIIVAGGTERDESDAFRVELVNGLSIHIIVHKDADGVAALRKLRGIRVELRLQKLELHVLPAGRCLKRLPVVRLGIEKCKLQ